MKLDYDDPLHGKAEAELLELVRLEDAKSFRLVIMHDNDSGEWHVETGDLETGANAFGSGPDFATAWHGQTGRNIDPPPPMR